MKLSNLSIIFVIIMLPIILVVSYYFSLQKSTLAMQNSYDQKLTESTKEAINAFEINTTEWNSTYSSLLDSKRRNVMASINTFITSLSNNLGISGTAKENILSYIPAIAFTLYDGYYVYAPAYTPLLYEDDDGIRITDDSGNLKYIANETATGTTTEEDGTVTTTNVDDAETTYEHTLTTYLPYSRKYTWGTNSSVVIEYTLDNYIKVYGTIDGKTVEKEGYLIHGKFEAVEGGTNNKTIKWNNCIIEKEVLTEQVMLNSGPETYKYIYDTQNEKYYYEDDEDDKHYKMFFRVVNGEKVYLNEVATIGDFDAKYRKVSYCKVDKPYFQYSIYQLLNGTSGEWFVDIDADGTLDERVINQGCGNVGGPHDPDCKMINFIDTEDLDIDGNVNEVIHQACSAYIYKKVAELERYEDTSSINYYIDAFSFTKWVQDNLATYVIDEAGNKFLEISATNNPEDENSLFAAERKEVIKSCVQETLTTSITQYANQTDGYNFRMYNLPETDWDQIVRNISMISFFQGVPIGLKYYNNYAIATNTTNNEYINKDEIYFTVQDDTYYHSVYTGETIPDDKYIIGYRNTDYIRKTYESESGIRYYYLHDHTDNTNSELACYNCIVGSTGKKSTINTNLETAYYTALGRERYVQNKNVKYVNGELRGDLETKYIIYNLNGGVQVGEFSLITEKFDDIPVTIKGSAYRDETDEFVYWYGQYKENGVTKTVEFHSGNIYDINASLDLTASYKVHIEYYDEEEGVTNVPERQEGIDTGSGYTTNVSTIIPEKQIGDTIYEFVGWSKEQSSKRVDYEPGAEITIYKNTILYPVWAKVVDLASITWRTNVGYEVYDLDIMSTENEEMSKIEQSSKTIYTYKTNEKFYIMRGVSGKTDSTNNAEINQVYNKFKNKYGKFSLVNAFVIENQGKKVSMYGNRDKTAKNAIWYKKNSTEIFREIKFDYDIEFGDSFISAGVFLANEESDGKLDGILVSFNNDDPIYKQPKAMTWYEYKNQKKYGSIWDFKYDAGNETSFNLDSDLELRESLDIPRAESITITINDNKMSIKCGEDELIGNIDIGSVDSFGFFSNHFSHGCNRIGDFVLDNIQIKMIGEEWEGMAQLPSLLAIFFA